MAKKLELTWIGKEQRISAEPRILIENPELSYSNNSSSILSGGTTDNMLIHGDNLLALKALQNKYAGKVKCIYIDPPYNTGSAFEHYDDNLEHSTWLTLMQERLILLKNLLKEDGAIFVQIDAIEMPYLKVLMDEIFSRNNFINIITVKTKIAGVSGSNLGKSLQDNTEYILAYAKNIDSFNINIVPKKKIELMEYINDYIEKGKSWKYTSILKEIDEGEYIKDFLAGNGDKIKLYRHTQYKIVSVNQIAKEEFNGDIKKAYYKYIDKVFRTTNAQTSIRTKVIDETKEYGVKGLYSIKYYPIKGKNAGKETTAYYKDNNLIAWLKDVVEIDGPRVIKIDNMGNLWDDIQYNNLTKEGSVQFPNGKKPEALIKRILEMATIEGDMILDSFLGSGTTCATAHKLNRRWIGIEMGDHAYTHCKKRFDTVIDGNDSGGVTAVTNWCGGGGYTFYELAPTLINVDSIGEPIINKEYNAEMLASAVALHEGFKYDPDSSVFWKQSKSNENAYLFVTTNHLNLNIVKEIESQMAEDEFLVIACKSFDKNAVNYSDRIKIKKIPQMLLGKCEFGVDNYNLNIINPPEYDDYDEED